MIKYFLSFASLAVIFTGCSQNTAETIPLTTVEDSVAQSVGYLLAADAVYSGLVNYSPMIDEAVNDIYNGKEQKIHQAYAYINALEIVNKAYGELNKDLDKDIILQSVHKILGESTDSLDFEKVQIYEKTAQSFILDYINKQMAMVHVQFLADVDKIEGIQKSKSGLRYIVETQGTEIGNTDNVKVNYVLYDYNGGIIDQSKNGSPFEFKMPSGVVPGFAESVKIAGYGGKIRSWVPAELGYGAEGSGQIAPGQTLIFEIEVLKK